MICRLREIEEKFWEEEKERGKKDTDEREKREKNIKKRGKRRVMEEKNKQREGIGEIKGTNGQYDTES